MAGPQASSFDANGNIQCSLFFLSKVVVVYRSPNIGQGVDVKLQNAIREVSKVECVIMCSKTSKQVLLNGWWLPNIKKKKNV